MPFSGRVLWDKIKKFSIDEEVEFTFLKRWHLHLTYTQNYWDKFCGKFLGRPVHHNPTSGGAAEGERFRGIMCKHM